MGGGRFSRIARILCWLFAFGAGQVWAEDTDVSRATLAGLQGVSVIVEELQPNVQKYAAKFGLTKAQVSLDVEKRLREAGIRVASGSDWLSLPGRPVLYININTHETEKYWFAYDVRVQLRQIATLDANPQLKTLAATWSLNITGQANIGTLNLIHQAVGTLVGRFVQAYRTVNKR
jgi:hypothetical protein